MRRFESSKAGGPVFSLRRWLLPIMGALMIQSAMAAERIVLRPSDLGGSGVELFIAASNRPGPRPVILFVHGHQEPSRPGGLDYVMSGRLERMAARGFIAAAVSQPGYGGSDGPPDYCGPKTQAAIRAALAHLRSLPGADIKRIILMGVSRGAIASAMVAMMEPDLKGLILIGGTYDLAAAYPNMPEEIRRNIDTEAGTTPAAFAARSVLLASDEIRADTLILHGRNDDRAPVAQAEELKRAIEWNGTPARLQLFNAGHMIPLADQWRAIDTFLATLLR